MKYITDNSWRTLLLLICFHVFNYSLAQQTKQITLHVGDMAPDLSVFKWIKGDAVKKWEKGKIYVVEFGATWCTPCAAAIPELSALQTKFKKDVVVISLFVMESNNEPFNKPNPEYARFVKDYVNKRADKINYTVGVDNPQGDLDAKWLKAAGLEGIPHLFVVDKKGMIAWIGGNVTSADNIVNELKDNTYELPKVVQVHQEQGATTIKYDRDKLLLIENNGGREMDFLFRSLLTRYDGKADLFIHEYLHNPHLHRTDSTDDKNDDKFETIGVPIGYLYYYAYGDTLWNQPESRNYWSEWFDTVKNPHFKKSYGKYWHEPILEVADKTPFEFNWNNTRHRYNYSLKVPKGYGTGAYLQLIFRNDLSSYFGYNVSVETRSMPYWKLTAPDQSLVISKLASKDQSLKYKIMNRESPFEIKNADTKDIIRFLGSTYGFRSLDYGKLPLDEQAAFIDETGITSKIDFTWDMSLTFEQNRAYLQSLGLELSKDYKPMKVVVIRDPSE